MRADRTMRPQAKEHPEPPRGRQGPPPEPSEGAALLTPGFRTSGSRMMRINFCCFEPSRTWDFVWHQYARFPPNLLNSGALEGPRRPGQKRWGPAGVPYENPNSVLMETSKAMAPHPTPTTMISAAGGRRAPAPQGHGCHHQWPLPRAPATRALHSSGSGAVGRTAGEGDRYVMSTARTSRLRLRRGLADRQGQR